MYSEERYVKVRRAVMVEGKSERETARFFGVYRPTVKKKGGAVFISVSDRGEVEAQMPCRRGHGDRPDHRHLPPVPAVPADHRGASDQRPRPPDGRVEEQSGLVDPNEVGAVRRDFFCTAGYSSASHRVMATGFRCFARRTGFWGEYRRFDSHSRR